MNNSTPAVLSSIDTSSSSSHPSSSDTITPKDAASPTRSAANALSVWRSILDTHGKEILECASTQFLDLATALRLETINARDLVDLLAKARSLRHRGTDVVEDDLRDLLVHEALGGMQRPRPCLHANSAPTRAGQIIGQSHSDSAASPQTSPVEPSREPKRRKTDERGVNGRPRATGGHPTQHCAAPLEKQGNNGLKRIRGAGRMQDQRLISAIVGGNPRPGPGTEPERGTVLHVKSPLPKAGNILKRPHIQRGVLPVSSSDAKQSQGISAQRIELVVITDTEPESSEDDKN